MPLLLLDSIPIAPPKGTPPPPTGELLMDVQMAEQATPAPSGEPLVAEMDGSKGVNGVNGMTAEKESEINGLAYPESAEDMNVDTPVASLSRTEDDADSGDFSQPPPAKRARKLSDADQASLAHVSTLCLYYAVDWRANILEFEVACSLSSANYC